MKTELSKIAQDLEQGVITDKEARTLLLGLLGVIQQSEQLFCECPNNFDIYQETKIYHSGCNKEVKILRTK